FREEVFAETNKLLAGDTKSLMQEQAELKRELTRHHAEMRKLATKGTSGTKTTARIAELHERIAQAERRLLSLNIQFESVGVRAIAEGQFNEAMGSFDELWDALSPREQSEVLRLLIAKIEYDAEQENMSLTFHPDSYKALGQ